MMIVEEDYGGRQSTGRPFTLTTPDVARHISHTILLGRPRRCGSDTAWCRIVEAELLEPYLSRWEQLTPKKRQEVVLAHCFFELNLASPWSEMESEEQKEQFCELKLRFPTCREQLTNLIRNGLAPALVEQARNREETEWQKQVQELAEETRCAEARSLRDVAERPIDEQADATYSLLAELALAGFETMGELEKLAPMQRTELQGLGLSLRSICELRWLLADYGFGLPQAAT